MRRARDLESGRVYRHFRGTYYEVVGLVRNSEVLAATESYIDYPDKLLVQVLDATNGASDRIIRVLREDIVDPKYVAKHLNDYVIYKTYQEDSLSNQWFARDLEEFLGDVDLMDYLVEDAEIDSNGVLIVPRMLDTGLNSLNYLDDPDSIFDDVPEEVSDFDYLSK